VRRVRVQLAHHTGDFVSNSDSRAAARAAPG
jgi:hypothetical protein